MWKQRLLDLRPNFKKFHKKIMRYVYIVYIIIILISHHFGTLNNFMFFFGFIISLIIVVLLRILVFRQNVDDVFLVDD